MSTKLELRMGIGLLFSTASMAAWAMVDGTRRSVAINEGISANVSNVATTISFNSVGQTKFYYTDLPKSMSSIASTLSGVGSSAANLVASLIMNAVDDIAKRGGNEGWIPSNINKGHYDYCYWPFTGLSMVNFLYYIACCEAYGSFKGQVSKALDEKNRHGGMLVPHFPRESKIVARI